VLIGGPHEGSECAESIRVQVVAGVVDAVLIREPRGQMEDERLGDHEARIEEFTDVTSQQPHATILRQKPGVSRRQIVDDDDLVRAALEEPRYESRPYRAGASGDDGGTGHRNDGHRWRVFRQEYIIARRSPAHMSQASSSRPLTY
jgi:hypothetical protein